MAKKFNGSSQALSTSATVNLTGVTKITVAYWMWVDNFGTNADNLGFESSANFNTNAGGVINDVSPSSPTGVISWGISRGDATSYNSVSIPQPAAGAWRHYAVTMDLANWATSLPCAVTGVSLDGVAQALTSVTLNGSAPADFGNFTWNFMSRNSASLWLAGRLDEFALWRDVNLSVAEIAAIARGQALPYEIQADHLVAFWPLDEPTGLRGIDRNPFRGDRYPLVNTGTAPLTGPAPRVKVPGEPKRRMWLSGGTPGPAPGAATWLLVA